MKKALIITTQRHFNFGTMLQCFGLQTIVSEHGYNVEVLDYLGNEYKRSSYQELRIKLGAFRRAPIKELRKLLYIYPLFKRERKFTTFLKSRINLTPLKYPTFQDIAANITSYDVYIAGSDQIWNPRLGGFKPAYFIEFVDSKKTKISYAASFGIDCFTEDDLARIASHLQGFKSISCRENSGVRFLEKNGIMSIQVLDPTFLLPAEFWRSIEKQPSNVIQRRDFVLSYFLSPSGQKYRMVSPKLYSLNLATESCPGRNSIIAAGPEEFLWMIDKCKLLVTDSFHGVVFALIFQKDFYVVPRNENRENSQNTRIVDLLNGLSLSSRWLPDCMMPENPEPIDYVNVSELLSRKIDDSKAWLRRQLKKNE